MATRAQTETAGHRSWNIADAIEGLRSLLSSRRALAVVVLVTLVAYSPVWFSWFESDDYWFLRGANESSLLSYTIDSFDPRLTERATEFNRYRPLFPIVWRWQFELFGINALPYHVVALGMQLACALMVWLIARRLAVPAWIATLATLVFAIHPAYSASVTWISANRPWATLPYLGALLFYMRFADRGASRRFAAYAAALLLYVVAILMHSSSVTLVAVVALYQFVFVDDVRDAWRPSKWIAFVPFFGIAIGTAIVQSYARDRLNAADQFAFGSHQFDAYRYYLGLLAVPIVAPDGGALTDAVARFRDAGVFALLGVMTWLIALPETRKLAIFASLWILVSIAPDSTQVLFLNGRALHVTGAPFALLVACGVMAVASIGGALWKRAEARAAAAAGLTLVIFALVAVTFEKADDVQELTMVQQRFAHTLRDEGPDVPAGGELYIADAPESLTDFAPSWLLSLARLYYPENEIRVWTPQSDVGEDDRIFRYEGPQ